MNFSRRTIEVFIIIIMSAIMSTSVKAQSTSIEEDKIVTVFLKDGSKISGALKAWKVGDEITLIANGVEVIIPSHTLKKVVEQGGYNGSSRIKMPFEPGIYYRGKLHFITGNGGDRASNRVGYGVSVSAGYELSQYLSLGIGTGYRELIWDSPERMIPVFAEVGGSFLDSKVSPTYNVELGYAFTWTDEDFNLIDAKGGMTIYPSLGVKIGLGDVKYIMDVGYLFQNAEYTYGSPFGDGTRSAQNLTYQRLSFRVGIQF